MHKRMNEVDWASSARWGEHAEGVAYMRFIFVDEYYRCAVAFIPLTASVDRGRYGGRAVTAVLFRIAKILSLAGGSQ